MRRVFPSLVIFVLPVLWLACDTEGNGDVVNTGPREGYPACYGTSEGTVISDLEFIDENGEPFFLSDVYRDGHNRLLMINSSAGWCSVCIEEQPSLVALHDDFADRGLYIMVSLFETASFAPANVEMAARWREQYDLPFTVVTDPTFILGDFYDATLTPMNMLIDVETMEILRISTGFDPSLVRSIVEARLL